MKWVKPSSQSEWEALPPPPVLKSPSSLPCGTPRPPWHPTSLSSRQQCQGIKWCQVPSTWCWSTKWCWGTKWHQGTKRMMLGDQLCRGTKWCYGTKCVMLECQACDVRVPSVSGYQVMSGYQLCDVRAPSDVGVPSDVRIPSDVGYQARGTLQTLMRFWKWARRWLPRWRAQRSWESNDAGSFSPADFNPWPPGSYLFAASEPSQLPVPWTHPNDHFLLFCRVELLSNF